MMGDGDATTALEAIVMFEGFQPYPPVDECVPVFSQPIDIVIDQVALKGTFDEDMLEFNVVVGIEMYDFCETAAPDGARTSVKLTRNRFEQIFAGIARGWFREMNVQVGGSPAQGNYFDTLGNGILNAFNRNVTTENSYNTMHDIYYNGLVVQYSGADQPSTYYFHQNTVEVAGFGNGVWIEDTIDQPSQSVEITQNTFNLNGPDQWGVAAIVSDNALIANNRIRGSGGIGVLAGAPDWWFGESVFSATNLLIKANNFNQADFGWAPVVLGPTSAYCTVVGGNNHTNVVDLGTDNILTSVNNGGQKLGQSISAKMQQLASVRRMVRGKP